jgi:polyphosphate glucokinase
MHSDETAQPRAVLAVDVGGRHVKMLATGEHEPREFPSGPRLRAQRMVERVLELTDDWGYDVVALGVPAQVAAGRVVHEPINLGKGWVEFDYEGAFGHPTRIVNDAVMQALGSYAGGRMLFLGLGTGLGSTLIVDGVVEPMELGHLPFRKATYEEYVGRAGRKRLGQKRWE